MKLTFREANGERLSARQFFGDLWMAVYVKLQSLREAAVTSGNAPLLRAVKREMTTARTAGPERIGTYKTRPSGQHFGATDSSGSLRSDLRRRKSLRSVMPKSEDEISPDDRNGRRKWAAEGLFDDLVGDDQDTSDCADDDKDVDGNCPDDPDFDENTRGEYQASEHESGEDDDEDDEDDPSAIDAPESPLESRLVARLAEDGEDKQNKEDVNYRFAGSDTVNCGNCRFFVEPGGCRIVSGIIRKIDVCDSFQASKAGAALEAFRKHYRP